MKQRILMNLAAIGITLAFLYALLAAVYYWSSFSIASSPDCSEARNSAIFCDPEVYLLPSIAWTAGAVTLLVVAILFTRVQLRLLKKTFLPHTNHLQRPE
ncbi:hypothetical protein EOL96_07370 [Candidatus Saccharibacteria bacterium]|nr:hypothetical protein [Candidatus Saccharibacteria bacterium]